MGLFKTEVVNVSTQVQKRAALVATHELVAWTNTAISSTGALLRQHQRDRTDGALEEAILNAETTLSLLRILKNRTEEP